MIRKTVYFLIFFAVIQLLGCSKYQKTLKGPDNEKKYSMAMEYYEKGDYLRALQLFDQLIPIVRGTDKAEKLYYAYAYCYYNQEDYILASYYFKQFVKNFPSSEYAEECYFKSAYCMYLDSPRYSLDQTNTYDALKELQLFINMYPGSERREECNQLIDNLRYKLQTKAFEIAKMYYKMEDFVAAITSFENILKDFPDTEYKEEILYYMINSYYRYAALSVLSKKKERYQSTIEAYERFITFFPDSKYQKEVFVIHKNAKIEKSKHK